MIRILQRDDLEEITEIHKKHFGDSFDFPSFANFISAFVVTDDNDKIITFGGLEKILECVVITDLSAPKRERIEALYKLFEALIFSAKAENYAQIHAQDLNDRAWKRHLKRVGFQEAKSNLLYFNV